MEDTILLVLKYRTTRRDLLITHGRIFGLRVPHRRQPSPPRPASRVCHSLLALQAEGLF